MDSTLEENMTRLSDNTRVDMEEFLQKDEELEIHQAFSEDELLDSFKACEESDLDEPEELF